MAYLNVRERRLETTIAYVGPSLAGKNTNLLHLKSGGRATDVMETDGALLSLEWSQLHAPRFNDCDVMVKVVAARGELSPARLEQILSDVDGVVVVVDAAPASREENRRTMDLVRASAAERPVVVQLNKSDLAGAIGAADFASFAEDWPVVPASAARGEGVVETLEIALESVIEAMKARSTATPATSVEPNPLLSALRQILRETVTEHMESVERSVSEKVARAAAVAVEAALGDVRSAVASLHSDIVAVQSTMAASAKESARALNSLVTTTSGAGQLERLDVIELATHEVMLQIAEVQTRMLDIATRGDVEAAETRVRDEIVTRGRGEREHATSAASVLRRAIDGIAIDVKKADRHAEIASAIERLDGKTDAIGEALSPVVATTTTTLGALPGRLAALETAVLRELRDSLVPRLGRVDDVVQIMNASSMEAFERSDKRVAEIHAGLTELLDELKKRKKGWFS